MKRIWDLGLALSPRSTHPWARTGDPARPKHAEPLRRGEYRNYLRVPAGLDEFFEQLCREDQKRIQVFEWLDFMFNFI